MKTAQLTLLILCEKHNMYAIAVAHPEFSWGGCLDSQNHAIDFAN